jgi:hypothetical protein
MGGPGLMPILQHATDREEWSYMCIDSDYSGIEMRPRADLCEFVHAKDHSYAEYQGVFKPCPHLQELATQDLYSPHPTKPHLWEFEGLKRSLGT